VTSWWSGLAPAQTALDCGGQTHRLRWADGELAALDHEDADGERALAALGGERCACVDMLDAWARHATDERLLVLASRGPADSLAADPGDPMLGGRARAASVTPAAVARPVPRPGVGPGVRPVPGPGVGPGVRPVPGPGVGWVSSRRLGRVGGTVLHGLPPGPAAGPDPDADLTTLLALGGGLPDRLLASVIAAWTRRLDEPGQTAAGRSRPRLQAALYGRAAAALQAWLGSPPATVEVEMVPRIVTPTLSAADGGGLRAELPFAWLGTVWMRGLATVMGRFCLAAVSSPDGRTWTLTTVGPDLGPTRPITIALAA
jgi:hypothetical protein